MPKVSFGVSCPPKDSEVVCNDVPPLCVAGVVMIHLGSEKDGPLVFNLEFMENGW